MKMSGECYSGKNLLKQLTSSKETVRVIINEVDTLLNNTVQTLILSTDMLSNKTIKTDNSKTDFDSKNAQVNKLLEYENMVSSAESKCSQLKGQLERIKQYYTNKAEGCNQKINKSARSRFGAAGSFVETKPKDSVPTIKSAKIIRQNSQAISTDTTGAALGTINNILAGITKSIEMPEFFTRIDQKNKHPNTENKTCRDSSQIHGVEQVKINAKSKQSVVVKSKTKFIKSKRSATRVISKTSSTTFKKAKKSAIKIQEVKNRSNEIQFIKTGSGMNKKNKKIIGRPRYTPKPMFRPKFTTAKHDLVELYHNTAVKESKSSDSDVAKKRMMQKENEKIETKEAEIVPPLNIETNEDKEEQNHKTGVVSCLSRNYAMPTISSRMKRVAKYYMSSFNIKTIPFCPATSTSPSHNIGINIQQVMNMVKTKQPAQKLSPTLAYNIGLAAGKWEHSPISVLVSSVTSKSIYSRCPLSRSTVNYQHLQEMAKTFPQEIIQEVEENEDTNSPETQSMIITGPSGDVKVTNRKQTLWSATPDDKKCTCVPQKGLEFQQIINKFNGTICKPKMNKSSSFTCKIKELKPSPMTMTQELKRPTTECTPLQNKEKKLKEVLTKLHDEFDRMTKKYDELVKKREESKGDTEISDELEKLDQELNSKEEEIVMVMTLYKEVLALKQQVKTLKERTCSRDSIALKNQPNRCTSSYNNLQTTGLLNKLLRRIQHFQTHYKKN